jgi:predicted phosphate transport protein (TIGR00153 family)
MDFIRKLFGASPFRLLVEHTKKVHECVELIRPITEALLAEDYEKLDTLHNEMSKTEHEADVMKDEIRDMLTGMQLLSVGRYELTQFLAVQDTIADAAEDFSVVVLLRRTRMHPDLKDDFVAFVDQVISVSQQLLTLSEDLSVLAEAAFTGAEADRVLKAIDTIGQEEWKADKLQRAFAKHFYSLEKKLDPTTLAFYDKYCLTLSRVANKAESTAKFLRLIIAKK